ncbi:hypothetical protein GYMLUDRAFT_49424 [Collybiopsis luxurians FD-317 M1]|uniref:Unplaced genomic scaffold GYMLUscaffold_83, whole genome shotgun sequence n=1 Tax=Collybiopsis luxurians FD-317 M1 TaxID=944289 RepID=A0A0D0BUJ3_9AGAR|nr:hypothetical protein GYMLUDRAFT_49424 [Collybiopsis luxurians FD-317 M1]
MPAREFIQVHDSDSEPDVPQVKRQKTNHLSKPTLTKMPSDPSAIAALAAKNANLKGRRRFNADLEDLKAACAQGFVAHALVLKSVCPGEDDGTLVAKINTLNGEHVLGVNIMLSDAADYPKDHNCFSYTLDSNLADNIQSVVEKIAELPSRPIAETMQKILSNLAKAMNTGSVDSEPEDDDDEDEEVYAGLSDDDAFIGAKSQNNRDMARMQRDFLEIVSKDYRPGFIPFGEDDFCISVSLSVVKLAESIPARALMAWDRRLLSKTQHLVLLVSGFRTAYPPDPSSLKFHVGLSGRYKPGKEHAKETRRNFALITHDAEDELRLAQEKAAAEAAMLDLEMDEDDFENAAAHQAIEIEEEEEEEDDPERFDKFSLSGSLDSLMHHRFAKLVQMRRKHKLGWAGAEYLFSEVEKSQRPEDEVLAMKYQQIQHEDLAEREMIHKNTTVLPDDPLYRLGKDEQINWPLTAFSYLIRRLTLCTRYCIVCHNKLHTDYVALKPYVCDSKLCAYQYYSLNHGPSLEYEIIHNPETVDLLVSITYSAALEGALDEPLPIGMGLRVPPPDPSTVITPQNRFPGGILPGITANHAPPAPPVPVNAPPVADADGLCDFDALDIRQMRASVVQMLNSLPPIGDMKRHLERKVKSGESKPKLSTMPEAADVLPAAWKILRWCVGSCTAYLEEISSEEESIKNIGKGWRQYRFSVGAPDAEAKFKTAVEEAKARNANTRQYPSLYAFHGSPIRNWHSIIRHGLWYKTIANGRAYGNGVYLAKDGQVSMGHYAGGNTGAGWPKSKVGPTSCVALVEVVNLPLEFVSSNPYFVVNQTHWLVVRYLLVKTNKPTEDADAPKQNKPQPLVSTPFVPLDPAHPLTLGTAQIQIPEPTFQLQTLLRARQAEVSEDDPDDDDQVVFGHVEPSSSSSEAKGKGRQDDPMLIDDDEDGEGDDDFSDGDIEMDFDYAPPPKAPRPTAPSVTSVAASGSAAVSRQQKPKVGKSRPADDWVHDTEYVRAAVSRLMPPPEMSTPGATMAVQKELKAMLKEQNTCNSFKELGWYMPEEFMGDNLFQWIVELHSFDETLPIAKDMKARKLNSIIFEIRFPPDYPLSPPFFRIITPRFLPFIQGGGGHVTGGGSICMDLLTSSGWLPSYNISSVLLQIKLAISNLDPRPARLAHNWDQPYGVEESLQGFKRAAATHNWIVPKGIDNLVR